MTKHIRKRRLKVNLSDVLAGDSMGLPLLSGGGLRPNRRGGGREAALQVRLQHRGLSTPL